MCPIAEDESFWLGVSTEKTGGPFRLFAQMRDKHRLNVHSGRPAAADADSAFHFSTLGRYTASRGTPKAGGASGVSAADQARMRVALFAEPKSFPVERALVPPSSCS